MSALRSRILSAAARFANELVDAIEGDAMPDEPKAKAARVAITEMDRARARKALRRIHGDK